MSGHISPIYGLNNILGNMVGHCSRDIAAIMSQQKKSAFAIAAVSITLSRLILTGLFLV